MRASLITYCILATLGIPVAAFQSATPPIQPAPGDAQFRVLLRGAAIGTATSSLTRDDRGWLIRGTSRLNPPLDVTIAQLEVRYSDAWQPQTLTMDLATRGQSVLIRGLFQDGLPDRVEVTGEGVQPVSPPAEVDAHALVLPNFAFGAFEALAVRLSAAAPGEEFRAYIAPQGEIPIRINSVTDATLQTAERSIPLRRWSLTFVNEPGRETAADVWTDGARLARFDLPDQALTIIRNDLAAVGSRVIAAARPNDEEVFIQAAGFNLAATVSRPATATASERWPAVILVGGSEAVDRDETIAGVPVLGSLAGPLADRGFLVVRFDRRGVGQSGGRSEAATMDDFAEDVRAIARFLRRRRDVDRDRLSVVGYGEGGWVALLTARRDDRIGALVLAATAATTGRELVLEQQQHMLTRGTLSESARQEAIDLQRRILDAVVTGTGWETIPAALRQQTDTAWYRSVLTFSPLPVLREVRQPMLIVHGELDRQVPAHHADELAQLARSRPRNRGLGSDLAKFPALNHLLVPASTGEVSEYATLPDRVVSPDLANKVADWLQQTLPVRAGR